MNPLAPALILARVPHGWTYPVEDVISGQASFMDIDDPNGTIEIG